MMGQTNVVNFHDPLIRQDWVKNRLGELKQNQFFAPYSSNSETSVVYNAKSEGAGKGHTVTFQTSGALEGNWVGGDTTLQGTGEQQLLFEDSITVKEYRTAVDLGTYYNAQEVDNLESNMHSYAIGKLGDLWNKAKDQMIFDVLQRGTTDRLCFSSFGFNTLYEVSHTINTGYGYVDMKDKSTKRPQRLPLTPINLAFYGSQQTEPKYILFIDSAVETAFFTDMTTQNILAQASVRGEDNMLLSGVIGQMGNILVVRAPSFFGASKSNYFDENSGYANPLGTKLVYAGLRQYYGDDASFTPNSWTGTSEFATDRAGATKKLFSRCVLVGASAVQFGTGRAPFYTLERFDHDHKAESGLSVVTNAKTTILNSSNQNSDYSVGITRNSFGAIAIDVQIPDAIATKMAGVKTVTAKSK